MIYPVHFLQLEFFTSTCPAPRTTSHPTASGRSMIQGNEQDAAPRQLNVVLDWAEELKRRVTASK